MFTSRVVLSNEKKIHPFNRILRRSDIACDNFNLTLGSFSARVVASQCGEINKLGELLDAKLSTSLSNPNTNFKQERISLSTGQEIERKVDCRIYLTSNLPTLIELLCTNNDKWKIHHIKHLIFERAHLYLKQTEFNTT